MKLLALFLIAVAAVAYILHRGQGQRRRDSVEAERREAMRARTKGLGEDMTECPVCGTYRAASAEAPCERGDCPYRRRGGAGARS
ncbi:MAG: hypothetical protein HXY25_03275 [Alphaproteobacteria bacterium]|nr:hypothetical protein [Alphaproteobacteria bacterium]